MDLLESFSSQDVHSQVSCTVSARTFLILGFCIRFEDICLGVALASALSHTLKLVLDDLNDVLKGYSERISGV